MKMSDPLQSKAKRQRLNPTHRWTEQQTLELLQGVVNITKGCPELFQKPTSKVFYDKLKANRPVLQDITWMLMKNKMANMKATYLSAVSWKINSGAGVLTNGDESSIKSYIKRICPHFELLSEVYGHRENDVTPDFSFESTTTSDIEFVKQETTVEETDPSNMESSIDTDDSEGQSSKLLKNSHLRKKAPDPYQKLWNIEQRKYNLEIEKLQFAREVEVRKLNIKQEELKLEREKEKNKIELKKLEIESEQEMLKIKLDSEERIKKYELDLKYK